MITKSDKNRIFLISDPHLIANKLHDDSAAFQRMKDTSAGKDLLYQETVLRCFVKFLLEQKPAALVITGDITFNGAKVSAEKFSELMQPLITANIAVLILPGNHDIYDGWARKFAGSYEYRTDEISPAAWKSIFYYSYQKACAIDSNSLAYSVNFNPDYRFIMADSNIYASQPSLTHPITNGVIRESQIEFIHQQLQEAKQAGQKVLFFMHHNLYAHNVVVNDGFVLNNAVQLRRLLTDYNVKLAFSGHIHAQSIMTRQKACSTTEIVSSCFAATDQGYGIVDLSKDKVVYQRHSFHMKRFLSSKERQNPDLINFHSYLFNIFQKTNKHQILEDFGNSIKDEQVLAQIANLLVRMHWLYFTGAGYQKQMELKQIRQSDIFRLLQKKVPSLRGYLNSLLDAKNDSRHCVINY